MAGEPIDVSPAPAGPTPVSAESTLNVNLNDEAAIRALANEAELSGKDVVVQSTQTSPLESFQAQQAPTSIQAQPPLPQTYPVVKATPDVPAKFVKSDGTVDVEKLQASSRQLDAATEQKVLSIDEMVAQYKEKERAFKALPRNPEQVAQLAQEVARAPVAPPQPTPNQDALQQQILTDLQRDPVGTIIDIVRTLNAQEQKPIKEFMQTVQEQQRDNGIKSNIAELAKADPRVANPGVYAEIVKELDSDPGYWKLKNPHKAAYNEVKARLRLGDVTTPAQPGRPAAPILGGGTPPPVPSTSGSAPNALNIQQAIGQMKTPQEQAAVESELRRLMMSAGQ
jgi:hypothetical protein